MSQSVTIVKCNMLFSKISYFADAGKKTLLSKDC